MSSKSELWEARSDLMSALDEKLRNLPEWRAFRAIDRLAFAAISPAESKPGKKRGRKSAGRSYGDLGVAAIKSAAAPQPTNTIMEYVIARRGMGSDPKKAKTNVQSALSRDSRIESIPWHGGRAWWLVGLEPPKDNGTAATAATGLPGGDSR